MLPKKRYLIVVLISCAAIAVSLLLIPSQKEIALMRLKNDHFIQAYQMYQQELAQGNLFADTVNDLTDAYLEIGKVDKAIGVMETFIASHPNDIKARRKLGLLYQYAQRQDDYIRNLEAINALQPDADTLSKLSELYNTTKQYDKQADTLKALIKMEGNKNPSHVGDLAYVMIASHPYVEVLASVQKQLASGEISEDIVDKISSDYMDKQEFNEACGIMEILVAAHPDDLAKLKKMAMLYKNARRQDDYARTLETISKLEPDIETFETLANLYNATKQYDKEVVILKKIIDMEKGKNPVHYRTLAYVLVATHSYGDAVSTLRELHKRHPDKFTFKEAELLVTCLLDDKKPDEALSEASGWVEAHHNADDSAALVAALHFKGNAELASKLLSHFTDTEINANGALLEQYAQVEEGLRKGNDAWQRLKALHNAGHLPPALNKHLLFMAGAHNEKALVHELMKKVDLKTFSEAELLSLLEIAQGKSDNELLAFLTSAFPDAENAEKHPLLMAALAVANHAQDAAQKLAKLDSVTLGSSDTLHIARVCANVRDFSCADHFLDKVKSNEGLTDAEVANIGALYFQTDQQDKGYVYMVNAMKTRNSPEIAATAVQYAVARGDNNKVQEWINANQQLVDPQAVSNLFYIAINQERFDTAVLIGEFAYAKFDTAESRGMLAYAYLKTGQFAGAVKLLRQNNPKSEADESSYLAALNSLAPFEPSYRKELGEYVIAKLRAGNVPEKEKQSLVYMLLNAKALEYAMPYIHELAVSDGGEWAMLYAGELAKQGKYDEARPFWIKAAADPSTKTADKFAIGSLLLDHGYKADAQNVFMQLAIHASPDSNAMKALLYLWGPKPTPEQLQWIEKRYEQTTHVKKVPPESLAPKAGGDADKNKNEKDEWADVIANVATDDALIEFVKAHPDSISSAKIAGRYFEALAEKGELAAVAGDIIGRARDARRAETLSKLGRIAEQNGLTREARKAYEAVIVINPEDNDALREAGLIAAGQGDHANAEIYLGEYIAAFGGNNHPSPDDYRVFFTYGELQLHNKRSGSEYFETAIGLIDEKKLDTLQAISIKAQSQLRLGQVDDALDTFHAGLAKYPGDDGLRADLIGTLVGLKRYKEARCLLIEPAHAAAGDTVPALALPGKNDDVAYYTLSANSHELLLHMLRRIDQDPQWKPEQFTQMPWISYTTRGYDTMLLATKPAYKLVVDDNTQPLIITAVKDDAPAAQKAQRQIALRYKLLAAQIDLETGHPYAVSRRLPALLAEYPDDPQVLSFVAGAKNSLGNWPRAEQWLAAAQTLSPENEDIQRFQHELQRQNGQNLAVDYQWLRLGSNHENITTLTGATMATPDIQLGISVQHNQDQTKGIRLSDGRVGDFTGERERAELYAQYFSEDDARFKASLFSNNGTPGLGGYYSFLDTLGETTLSAEWHKPYWDLAQAVLDDATRDRLAVAHTIKPDPDLTIIGGASANRYNTSAYDNATTSVALAVNVIYRLMEDHPYMAIGYGFDMEHELNHKMALDSTGINSSVFPELSRQVHVFSLNTAYQFSDATRGDIWTGYAYDQLNDTHGPVVSGTLTHQLTDALDLQLRASYGLSSVSVGSTSSSVAGNLRWRF